eukprot:SAG22_NODE_12932_length_424_cov_1.040000_1_plen_99_part_01
MRGELHVSSDTCTPLITLDGGRVGSVKQTFTSFAFNTADTQSVALVVERMQQTVAQQWADEAGSARSDVFSVYSDLPYALNTLTTSVLIEHTVHSMILV